MTAIQTFFQLAYDRQDLILQTLWEHVNMSLISLLIAVFIAVPLAILLTHYTKVAEPVIGSAAVLQTIPSLALLGFLIPFLGIGTRPAIVALTAYALLPILRNTYTGVKGIDPALMEASRAMGMDVMQQLFRVQLPLAMPTIMAGIRTAMVLIVGTATLAALIGAGGFGDLIMIGLQRSNSYYILLGAIPAALLALFFDVILRVTERKATGASIAPILVVVGLALIVVITPAAYSAISSQDEEEIVLAGKVGAEPEIIINMYKLLIEQEADFTVSLQPGLNSTDYAFQALLTEDIDGYYEFTGTAITTLLEQEPVSNDEMEAYEQARDGLYEEFQLVLLEPFSYQNTYAIAVREAFAEENDLETISDLAAISEGLTAGFTFEFIDRPDGYPNLEEVYNLTFQEVRGMDPGLRSEAVVAGDVDVIDAYSTESYMVRDNLIALEDDLQTFPPFNGAALFREEVLEQYPEIEEALAPLSGMITEEEMLDMNFAVDEEDRSAEEVAREFLIEQGLLEE